MATDAGLHILIVDDEPDMVATLNDLLAGDGHHVHTAHSGQDALERLEHRPFDLILTDLSMPGVNGVDLLKEAKTRQPNSEVIIITGYGTINSAVDAMRQGAFNYLIKPVEPQEILQNVDRVSRRLSFHGTDHQEHRFHNLIGKSSAMRKIFNLIPRVARMPGSVLIQGESGVGKELVAHAIHACSARSSKRFVPIDCGALSDTLLESELFGHKQGSFTGSTSDRIGMIETAHGGTLLLDEVGNGSGLLQSRLLRVIEEKKVRRVGENNFIPIDIRILAATNASLGELVEKNLFREDLYYRLCGFVIEIPPLRERIEDIPLLAQYFLEQNAEYYDSMPSQFSPEALETLMHYPWPGNVRELRIVIDRAVALSDGARIERRDLTFGSQQNPMEPSADITAMSSSNGHGTNGAHGSMLETPFYSAVEDFERAYLTELLEKVEGNISQASHLSGASRKTIREKGKKYGLL